MFGQQACVRHVQIEKLAAGVGHVANFGDAFLETCFVASENGRTELEALLNNLGFEGFRVRASLAHGNPDVKGNRVRLNTRTPSSLMLELGR